ARAVPGRAVMQRRGRGLRARSLAQAAHVAYVSRAMGSVLKFFRALSGAGERRTFTARPPSTFSFPLFFVFQKERRYQETSMSRNYPHIFLLAAAAGLLVGACDPSDMPIGEQPGVYEPCADKGCGETCNVCDPDDADCVETA